MAPVLIADKVTAGFPRSASIRCAGSHAVYVWTFTGHDAKTGNPVKVHGWEEWDLGDDLQVKSSRGWYDADDYARQGAGA